MNRYYSLFIFLLFSLSSHSQQPNVYDIYEQQYQQLLGMRGVSENEITKILKDYASNKLNNDHALANIFKSMYSSGKGIGMLFYFFNNDTLRRAFYTPGKIREIKSIAISREKLLKLNEDINLSMNLYQLSQQRSPKQRGVTPFNNTASQKIPFEKAVRNASDILLPASLDTSIKHLLIIPAMNIGTIPFYTLPLNKKLLIDQCSYTIVPSLIDFVALRTKLLKKNTTKWVGSALPDSFDKQDEFVRIDEKKFQLEKVLLVSNPQYPKDSSFVFPDLPGAEKETAAALPYAKKVYLLKGKDAIKDKIRELLFESNLAWFATHGISDQHDPMGKSFLVLSEPRPYLTAREIMGFRSYNRPLPEMVILSACQTGLGRSMEAGTAGLARSFLLGGSDHVIVSLWNVDDESTAYFMERFIFHLQQPHRFMPATQLRLAALDTRKKYKQASKWASFSLFGIDY